MSDEFDQYEKAKRELDETLRKAQVTIDDMAVDADIAFLIGKSIRGEKLTKEEEDKLAQLQARRNARGFGDTSP
jgi:hypothetical protein